VTRVILTVQAELDLEEIGDRIAADDPERALSFVSGIRGHCGRTAKAPPT
jgi:plasmid stabilization system protein ParE